MKLIFLTMRVSASQGGTAVPRTPVDWPCASARTSPGYKNKYENELLPVGAYQFSN